MKSIKQISRLLQINLIFTRNGLSSEMKALHLFPVFRFLIYLNPGNWFYRKRLSRGVKFRKTLEELGPIFVKFGQALSTRPDLIPEDIAIELCKLQDKVPPFSSSQALDIIQATFNCEADTLFAKFNPIPFASASIAQVHAAILHSGEEVIVKVLRPNIRQEIEIDLSILRTIANLSHRYLVESRQFKPKEVVREFEITLLNELDMRREAANAARLRRNFLNSSLLYVPAVFWDYTRKNVLVMERIYGIPISDALKLQKHNINIKKLAEKGVEIFFTQVFKDSFFHADMHPGNIFVSDLYPEDPQYICVDFGIMGSLTDKDKRYIAEILYAVFTSNYRRVAEIHLESGWLNKDASLEDFEMCIRIVCEPIFEKPLKNISLGLLLLNLFQVAQSFKIEVQPQLMLLLKTLLAIEGLGRQLYPDLDIWATAKPLLKKWLKEQVSLKAMLRKLQDNLPFITEQLPSMPRLAYEILLLNKKQLSAVTHDKFVNDITVTKNTWKKGFVLGIAVTCLVFVVFFTIHYKI